MPETHAVVRGMAVAGELEITQLGKVCDVATKIRGPYRIRLPK